MSITGALVLVVMSMVIPIPAALLDVGIALSIATATLILVMASVVTRPTDFQAFPVMLLDEPTASLDAANREVVLTLIEEAKARGAAILGIFHDEAARARLCDREIDVSGFTP